MKPSRTGLFPLALAALILSTPAAAQWKWRDAQGLVQYSDLPPPPGVPERDVLKRPGGASAPPAQAAPATSASAAQPAPGTAAAAPSQPRPAALGTDQELESRRRAAEQARNAQRKAEEQRLLKERAEQCTQTRGYLRALESGERMARLNEHGERQVLDDARRAEEIVQVRRTLATHCR